VYGLYGLDLDLECMALTLDSSVWPGP